MVYFFFEFIKGDLGYRVIDARIIKIVFVGEHCQIPGIWEKMFFKVFVLSYA